MKDARRYVLSSALRYVARDALGRPFALEARSRRHASEDVTDAWQYDRLRRLVEHAASTAPWYHERADVYLASLQHRRLDDVLRALPILSKAEARGAGPRIWSERGFLTRTVSTSGSTGTPMKLRTSLLQQARASGVYRDWLRNAGIPNPGRAVVLTGFRPPTAGPGDTYWHDAVGRRLLLNISSLGTDVPKLVAALRDFKPSVVHGYPSAIAQLASYWSKYLQDLPAPPVVSTGEVLEPAWRDRIQQTFPTIIDVYGSQENAHLAAECRYGSRHINPYVGIIEIVDDEDRQVGPGETGRVIVTGLQTFSMPLIRYEIGDRAEYRGSGQRPCPCGVWWPTLGAVHGRSDDVVRAPDGRMVPMLASGITRHLEDVSDVQIIQRKDGTFLVNLVPKTPSGRAPSAEDRIRASLTSKLGPEIVLAFKYVEQLDRSANSKARAVVVEK